MNRIKSFGDSNLYWILLILLGLSLEGIALYYQYALDEWPCVLCIHIRIWIMAFIVIAILALWLKPFKTITPFFHLANSLALAGFVERSWQTLAVERGWIFSDCNMDAGLPTWFELDKWFPAIFEVKTSCGYTPYIFLKISMAETLMAISVLLLCLSTLTFISCWWPRRTVEIV